jgi:hypothetical protein
VIDQALQQKLKARVDTALQAVQKHLGALKGAPATSTSTRRCRRWARTCATRSRTSTSTCRAWASRWTTGASSGTPGATRWPSSSGRSARAAGSRSTSTWTPRTIRTPTTTCSTSTSTWTSTSTTCGCDPISRPRCRRSPTRRAPAVAAAEATLAAAEARLEQALAAASPDRGAIDRLVDEAAAAEAAVRKAALAAWADARGLLDDAQRALIQAEADDVP